MHASWLRRSSDAMKLATAASRHRLSSHTGEARARVLHSDAEPTEKKFNSHQPFTLPLEVQC